MEKRNITITLEKAVEWFNSGNKELENLALQAFTERELKYDFKYITDFKKACEALSFGYEDMSNLVRIIAKYSKASAAMFKLNIIRKALNLGYDLDFAKNPKFYPENRLVTEGSVYGNYVRVSGLKIIGKIRNDGVEYNVLGGTSADGTTVDDKTVGLINFDSSIGVGYARANLGFLGCATLKIANHFSKYFGMLITEAKYGDIPGFKIIKDEYGST